MLTAGDTDREKIERIGVRNVAVPENTYIPLTVTEVNSGTTITVFNQAPALRGKQDVLWDNEPALNSTYNGTDVTLGGTTRLPNLNQVDVSLRRNFRYGSFAVNVDW